MSTIDLHFLYSDFSSFVVIRLIIGWSLISSRAFFYDNIALLPLIRFSSSYLTDHSVISRMKINAYMYVYITMTILHIILCFLWRQEYKGNFLPFLWLCVSKHRCYHCRWSCLFIIQYAHQSTGK